MSRFVFIVSSFAFLVSGFLTNVVNTQAEDATVAVQEEAAAATPAKTRLSLMPTTANTTKTIVGSDTVKVSNLGMEMLKGTLYCVAIFLFGASLYRRYLNKQQATTNGGIEIISRRALGSRTALLVVRTEGRRFFLSQTGEEVHLLAPLDEPASFEKQLAQFASTSSLESLAQSETLPVTVNG